MRMSGPLGQLQLDADKLKTKVSFLHSLNSIWNRDLY